MGPRPIYHEESDPDKCAQPTKDCFKAALYHDVRLPPTDGTFAWNQIKDGRFGSCPADCVGFDLENGEEALRLCSLTMNRYTPRFDREKNYIGFVFGAVRRNGVWYYNENVYRLVKCD